MRRGGGEEEEEEEEEEEDEEEEQHSGDDTCKRVFSKHIMTASIPFLAYQECHTTNVYMHYACTIFIVAFYGFYGVDITRHEFPSKYTLYT